MKPKLPAKKTANALRKADDGRVRKINPKTGSGGFVRFQYSYRSVSLKNGDTHVKARSARYEDGHLETEEFEGALPGADFMKSAMEAQRSFFEGMTRLFNPFAAFLPDRTRKRDRE
ncbi:MAG: hypothetical protein ACLFRG_21855 [Desulfococcaceae bacterium]